jgi:hypothetical protein
VIINMKKLLLLILLFTIQSVSYAQNGGTWTWIHGDSTQNLTGNYGTKGVSTPSNLPPGRYHPAFWKDLNGNFWMFGMSHSPNIADMWMYNPTINEWTWMSGSNTAAGTGNYGTKGIPSVNNYPPNRGFGASCWTDSAGDLWMYGGWISIPDLWRYNVTTNEWTWMDGGPSTPTRNINYGIKYVPSPSNFPGTRGECKSNWVHNNELILSTGDVWTYSIANNEWTWIGGDSVTSIANKGTIGVPSPTVRPSWGPSYTKWKYKDKVFFFGGLAKQDVWSFNLTTKLFTCELNPLSSSIIAPPRNCLHTTGYFPGHRTENHTIQSSECNRSYWTYGGGVAADLWLYYMDSNYWIRVSNGPMTGNWGIKGISNPTNHPKSKIGFGIWNDNLGNLYLFGGFNNWQVSPTSYYPGNDMWKFEPDPACLGSISLVGTPLIAPKKKSICHPSDSVVMTLDTAFFNINWNPTSKVTVNTDTSKLVFKPSSNTTFTVTAQGKCTAFDTITFLVKIGTPTYDTIYDTICTGTKWSQYPGSGIYNFVLTNQSGCDSNVELHLLKLRKDSFININICQGSSYTYNSVVYNSTGAYSTKFTAANGCDSNMILNLKVNPKSPLTTLVKKVCELDTFKYNGSSYTTDVIVTHILTNKFGCDSPVKLDLKFLPVFTAHIYDTFCSGDSFKFNNNQYYKTAGNYSYSFKNQFGCDSNVVLHLAMAGAGNDTIRIDSIVFGNMCSSYDKNLYFPTKYT